MPPIDSKTDREGLKSRVRSLIDSQRVMVFSKSYCTYCQKLYSLANDALDLEQVCDFLPVKELFNSLSVEYNALELDESDDGPTIADILLEMTGQKTVPNVFVNKEHVGGSDKTLQAHRNGTLQKLLDEGRVTYDYDLIVIGGGSGGLACSKDPLSAMIEGQLGSHFRHWELLADLATAENKKIRIFGPHATEAASLGKKVLVLDFVLPTPRGVSWGLGGTCVNVGCIPKKLMHQAALLGQALRGSRKFGWEYDEQVKHNWQTMTEEIQNYIGSLNWGYRVSLRDKKVTYENAYGEFVEAHKIKATGRNKKEKFYTAEKFVVATGERPRYLGIPGDKEYCITSDDLFSLPYCPGKTLVVGASYVALECAGFLAGIGLDVTVMVRSILLRGFDQEMAERAGASMEKHGVKFIRKFVPTAIEKLEDGTPGKVKVTAKSTEGPDTIEGEYNTILIAVGRDACTRNLGFDTIGVEINDKNGKVPVNDEEQTNVPYVYAIGDILDGKLELTPVAIQAGRLLARRLFGGSTTKCDYINVPTTVFTPIEYGCCGHSEERAIELYGEPNIEVYHTLFWPLEWTLPGRDNNTCYAKVICDKRDDDRVIGFHVLGPNAGEVTQGFGVAMKCGLTKELLDESIGIHPTCAEVFTTMEVTKNSGEDISQKGC